MRVWLVGPESEFPLRFNTIRGKTRPDCAFAIEMQPGNTKPRESFVCVKDFVLGNFLRHFNKNICALCAYVNYVIIRL